MNPFFLVATLSIAAAAPLAQDPAPAAPEQAPSTDQPAAQEPAPADAPAAAPAAAPADKAPPPFTLGRAADKPGKSPYATDMRLDHPPRVYVIPMEGLMGIDIHPTVYDRILKDLKTQKPDLVVFRLASADGTGNDKYMEAVNEAQKEDKIDPRRLASGITDYRDLSAKLHTELEDVPTVMYVQDSRGVSCVYALAWPYMFMAPSARISGLDVVAALGGGNDADIKAKMFSAWTGISKGILVQAGRPQELCDALVRPDRKLSADIEGRSTKWRSDTLGSWYVIDTTDEVAARFNSKVAEDTGLADGVAEDMADLMSLLGYPEFVTIDSGEKLFRDTNSAWRKRYRESKKWMEEFQQPMDGPQDLGKRKQILEKMQQAFKQSPQFAKMWEWTRGLTEDQLKLLIEQLTEQIRSYQKQQQGSGGGRSGGGRSGGGGGRGPAGPM